MDKTMDTSLITSPSFYPIRPDAKGLIGFGACLFAGRLSLNGIAIYTRPDGSGIRCLFPSKILPNGKELHIYYPVDTPTYNMIAEAMEEKINDVGKMRKNYGQYYSNI